MKKVILDVVIIVYIIIAIMTTIVLLSFNNNGIITMGDKNYYINKVAYENYSKNTLLVFSTSDFNDLVSKNVYYVNGEKNIVTDEVVNVVSEADGEYIINFSQDSIYSSQILGLEITESHSKIGKVITILTDKYIYLFVIILPVFVLFIFECYVLFKFIKRKREQIEVVDNNE